MLARAIVAETISETKSGELRRDKTDLLKDTSSASTLLAGATVTSELARAQDRLDKRLNDQLAKTPSPIQEQLPIFDSKNGKRTLKAHEAVLLKTYGLKDFDPSKTEILLNLQDYVMERIRVDGNSVITYPDEIEDIISEAWEVLNNDGKLLGIAKYKE
jgi:hypothetical protein